MLHHGHTLIRHESPCKQSIAGSASNGVVWICLSLKMKESFRVDELVVSDKDLDSSEIFFSGHNLYNLSVL